jgi:8-oxo-dGTP pyrophosphatase MutT (NUDIX family)
MLQLIPPPLHRVLYRVADRLRRLWWHVRRPRRSSAVVVAFDEADRVLLVRHSYGKPLWALPGGGINRGEAPEAAAAREFFEELRCPLSGLRVIERRTEDDSGSLDLRHTFVARLAGIPVPDMREIVEVGLFDPTDVPEPIGRWTAAVIAQAVAFLAEEARS